MTTRLEKTLVFSALALAMAPFALFGNTQEALDATLGYRLALWGLVYAGFIGLSLLTPGITSLAFGHGRVLLVLTGLTTLSIAWSEQPGITAFSSAALWGTTLIGVYMAQRIPPGEMLRLLAITLGVLAAGSALTIWLLPEYGVMSGVHEGLWNGLTTHKNALGRYMAMGVFVFACLAGPVRGLARASLAACAAFCFWLMLGTESATAYVLLGAIVLLFALLRLTETASPLSRLVLLLVCLCGIGAGALALSDASALETALNTLGRDSTLTNRTRIWSAALDAIGEHPWLGYGYEAFWSSRAGNAYSLHYTTWNVPHVHNGFLETWLALGLPGLLLLTLLCLQLLRPLMRRMEPDLQVLFVLAVTTSLVLNLVEFNFLRYNNIFWLLFIYVLLRLPQQHDEGGLPVPAQD